MSVFQSFEEIQAWQESRILIRSIREICKRENVQRDFAFVDQITRAARSISANIAEDNDSGSALTFAQFLSYAKRSAAEVRSHLYDAIDEKYVSQQEFEKLNEQLKKIGRMLSKLVTYLQQSGAKRQTNAAATK